MGTIRFGSSQPINEKGFKTNVDMHSESIFILCDVRAVVYCFDLCGVVTCSTQSYCTVRAASFTAG